MTTTSREPFSQTTTKSIATRATSTTWPCSSWRPRQPVASDLRFISIAFKIVVDLERIGDLAGGIAKRVLELNQLPALELRIDLPNLASLVEKNLHSALAAFIEKDATAARAVIVADAEIDRLNANTFAVLVAHVATDPTTINRVLPLTSVCRYLERIGDHVKNFAEDVIAASSGWTAVRSDR